MNLMGRLERIEKAIGEVNPLYGRAKTFEDVDAEIIRAQLETVVEAAIARKEVEFNGSVHAAADGELLHVLGLTDDDEGRTTFRDGQRAWLALLRRNRGLPCIGSEFGAREGVDPKTPAERAYFLNDVRWHLGWFQRKGFQTSIAQAVALYIFCQRNCPACITALLDALDELQADGEVFEDWGYPDIPISEAVQYIYDENKKIAKPGDDPYSFRLSVERKT